MEMLKQVNDMIRALFYNSDKSEVMALKAKKNTGNIVHIITCGQ